MEILNKLRHLLIREDKMARNLVKENEERANEESGKKENLQTSETDKKEIQVITFEDLILSKLNNLEAIMLEGFKQVGVKF
jgi:hypothetical protein